MSWGLAAAVEHLAISLKPYCIDCLSKTHANDLSFPVLFSVALLNPIHIFLKVKTRSLNLQQVHDLSPNFSAVITGKKQVL